MLQVWLNVKFSSQPNLDNECIKARETTKNPKLHPFDFASQRCSPTNEPTTPNKNHFIPPPPLFKPSQVFQTPNCPPLNPTPPSHSILPSVFLRKNKFHRLFHKSNCENFGNYFFSIVNLINLTKFLETQKKIKFFFKKSPNFQNHKNLEGKKKPPQGPLTTLPPNKTRDESFLLLLLSQKKKSLFILFYNGSCPFV